MPKPQDQLGPAALAGEAILAGILERADNALDEPYVSFRADPSLLSPVPIDPDIFDT